MTDSIRDVIKIDAVLKESLDPELYELALVEISEEVAPPAIQMVEPASYAKLLRSLGTISILAELLVTFVVLAYSFAGPFVVFLWSILSNIPELFTFHLSAQYRGQFSIALMKSSWAALVLTLMTALFVMQIKKGTTKKRIAFDDKRVGIGTSTEPLDENFILWSELIKIDVCKSMTLIGPTHVLTLTTFDKETVSINWKEVTDSVDSGSLINAMHTYAPDALKQLDIPAERKHVASARHGETFTKLWFKYYSTGTERKRANELLPGDLLKDGRYEILGTVGGGGQGTAYLARDLQDESKEIVLKEYILPLHRGNQVLQETIIKLEHEAELLRTINHQQIVSLRDCFIEDYRGYLVMEYVEGRTLKQIVDDEGPQPESVVRTLAMQACEIISYLHCMEPAVIHRDLTPDNFILQSNGLLKLVDFNVAHQLESQATATVVGKHCYIPPEQFRGKPTVQSDIYALGGTLHFLLTGCEPEPITTSHPKAVATAMSEVLGATISDNLNSIIAKATSPDTNRRYANIYDLSQDLSDPPK
jgi:tRNA A-37 threonylcarbamoyl transferase component Bud32